MIDVPSTENPSSIGQTLRHHRLQKNLTAEQVAQDTKIHIKFIRALEEERWADFPARVYLEGFLKRYAGYLGLGDEAMARQLRQEMTKEVKPDFSSPVPREESDNALLPPEAGRPLWFLAGGAALVMGLALAYVKLEERRAVLERPAITESVAPSPAAPPQPPAPVSHEVRVTAKSPVWARLWLDGRVKFEGILPTGLEKIWPVQTTLRVIAGNAALLTVSIDGRPLGPKTGGPAGEISWAEADAAPVPPAAANPPEEPKAPAPAAPLQGATKPAVLQRTPPFTGGTRRDPPRPALPPAAPDPKR